MSKLKDLRWKLYSRNPMSDLRTPYVIRQEWERREERSFSRFLIRFFCEETGLLFGAYKCWLNRQILLSHNVTIGKNFRIGSSKNILYIPTGGHVLIGDDVKINTPIELATITMNFNDVLISIGNQTHLGFNVSIRAAKKIRIGDNCLIAPFVTIIDTNAHPLDPDKRIRHERVPDNEIRPVEIGDNVWIGERAIITPGVKIGDGSVVGANSLVTKDVPENTIVAGNRARVASWLKKPVKGGSSPPLNE